MVRITQPQTSSFGVLTATEVRTATVNNPSGNLGLQSNSVDRLSIRDGFNLFNVAARLNANIEVQDQNGNVIIASDNSGHIDQLARIDVPVLHPDLFHIVEVEPAMALIDGGSVYQRCAVRSVGTETLTFCLSAFIPPMLMSAYSKIHTVIIEGTTGHNDDYITKLKLMAHDGTDTLGELENHPDDLGNGSTAPISHEWELATPRWSGYGLFLEVDNVIGGAAHVTIDRIRLWLMSDTSS